MCARLWRSTCPNIRRYKILCDWKNNVFKTNMIYCIYGICTNFIQMWLLLQKIIHEPIFFDPWCVGLVVECWCVFYVFLLPKTHPLPPQPSCKALVRLHPQRRDRNPIRKPDPFSSPMFFFRGKLGVKRQGGFFSCFFLSQPGMASCSGEVEDIFHDFSILPNGNEER